ncbi:primosomal protein N' [Tumebacillus algifaecis]|uniref:Replication restart protein PriA n=1 Tax=Tumebacillus algifaecis TaxID=1214604 RepID=A0A223D2K9_9BACL|nr:primosomal protein N' [Tumebacillus algifaecis]ASS75725.1 primosomal protein N' [Tumebacillus algifaecis]
MSSKRFAEVIVELKSSQVDRPFHYEVPDHWQQQVEIGTRVLVPFGPRRLEGYIVGFSMAAEVTKTKPILEVLDDEPPLTPDLVQLAGWLSERYLCTTAAAVQALLPSGMRAKASTTLRLADELPFVQPGSLEADLLQALYESPNKTKEQLIAERPEWRPILRAWVAAGILIESYRIKQGAQVKTITCLRCTLDATRFPAALEALGRAKKQKEVLAFLFDRDDAVPMKDVLSELSASSSTLKPLLEKGYIQKEEQEVLRDPYGIVHGQKEQPLPLTELQRAAYDQIAAAVDSRKPETFLLQGVTGSGKTEVYLQAIASCVAQGRQAIMLVPEISLTPQMVERFKKRFGDDVAVMHSRLSAGEKFDEWRRIRQGDVTIVVGARSAIFAPFHSIGLMIVDEEHEVSYKQDDHPKYLAREVAMYRARQHGATVVLGSATPALETRWWAHQGQIRRIEMSERVMGQRLPKVKVIDMRNELQEGNRSMFSTVLQKEMEKRLETGEQIILFLNRRGFATFVLCRSCGYVARCPECEIPLTFHKARGLEQLRCHYCGYAERMPNICPDCQGDHVRHFGTGTQRVEEELNRVFPEANVIRMDVDTTSGKGSHAVLLQRFRNQEAQILLGTQMIAKGLDFPNVTLVGVISADTSLFVPDFRAAERTFQLLTQVAGRAGRHQLPGEVVIQSYNPQHYAVQFAKKQEYENFFQHEIRVRHAVHNPPFRELTAFTSVNVNETEALRIARTVEDRLRILFQGRDDVIILGTSPAPLSRLQGKFRFNVVVKYVRFKQVGASIRTVYLEAAQEAQKAGGYLSIDVNAQMIL